MLGRFMAFIAGLQNGWRHPYGHDSVLLIQQRRHGSEQNYAPYVRWLIEQRRQDVASR